MDARLVDILQRLKELAAKLPDLTDRDVQRLKELEKLIHELEEVLK